MIIVNDNSKAGKVAAKPEIFGPFSRYSVYPVHTRFGDSVQWFVSDAEDDDPFLGKAIIRQAPTKAEAMKGLDDLPEGEL